MTGFGRLLSALILGCALLAWVGLCGAVFWFLYSQVLAQNPVQSVQALQGMLWPFTVVMLGIPLLVFLAFGGLRAIRELVALQGMVAAFPKDIVAMREAVEVFKGVREDIARARDDLVRARTDLGLASSELSQNLADGGEGVAPTEGATLTPSPDSRASPSITGSDPQHVEAFEVMYRKAKRYYRAAVQKYTRAHPDDATFNPGDDWIEITKRLRDLREAYFDPGRNRDQWYANWVIEMIKVERSTRKNRAARLDADLVRKLQDEQPPD